MTFPASESTHFNHHNQDKIIVKKGSELNEQNGM